MRIDNIAGMVGLAFPLATTPGNITAGFRVSGLVPFNRFKFDNEFDFAPSYVTDRSRCTPVSTATQPVHLLGTVSPPTQLVNALETVYTTPPQPVNLLETVSTPTQPVNILGTVSTPEPVNLPATVSTPTQPDNTIETVLIEVVEGEVGFDLSFFPCLL